MLKADDIKKMYALSPQAKLILLLRNPVDRAWSHFRHSKKRITGYNYETVSQAEILTFMDSDAQVLRSDYVRTTQTYTSIFPKEQLLIGFFDAIQDDPERLLTEITQFIGADSSHSIQRLPLNRIINKSPNSTCPTAIREYLKTKYHDQIKLLADRHGGYFGKWYRETYNSEFSYEPSSLLPTFQLP